MFDVDIKIEGLDEVIKSLDDLGKKQIPFATSLALNKTANDARNEIVKRLPEKYTLTKKWYKPGTRYGINVKPSTKKNLTTEIYTRAPWMRLHEEGGVKRARGKYLAIPTRYVRRGKMGVITKASRPAGLKRSFIAQTKRGLPVIFRRKSKKVIQPMYVLKQRAQIKPTLGFRKTVVDVVNKRWNKNFDNAFDQAMRTAK